MTIRIYIPGDAAAIAVGADGIAHTVEAQARRNGVDIRVVRNGSRGMLWLEPLIEVETENGRVAYGPVTVEDVPGLFAAGFHHGRPHPLCHGFTQAIPFLKNQERLTFARVGVIDPVCLDDYLRHGGFAGLLAALEYGPATIIDMVTESGLRGRGGAAFPAGIKWKTVADTAADKKYIVCNADEGDSGSFSDRLLMEGDPYTLIEGMTIAGLAVNAAYGYIYVRSEYPYAIAILNTALERARAAGWLGRSIAGGVHSFDIEVRKAAGAYICGEETAMLESLEGKRGLVRVKPPLPAVSGLFGAPTLVNNVVTLASVPVVLSRGAAFYRNFGVAESRGTLAFQLGGNIRHGGLVEKAFGVTLRTLLYDFGGGSASGRPLRAVQLGGPLGAYLPSSQWDVALDYEACRAIGAMVGHGGIVAFDDTANMADLAEYAMEFCAIESCGKCTPCRIGSVRGAETIRKIRGRQQQEEQLALLNDLCDTMETASLCALGGMTPYPVMSTLQHFPEDFGLQKNTSTAESGVQET